MEGLSAASPKCYDGGMEGRELWECSICHSRFATEIEAVLHVATTHRGYNLGFAGEDRRIACWLLVQMTECKSVPWNCWG